MKAASYPDFGLELLVPEQIWIDDVCTYDISAKYGISHWWFTRQKFYIDRHDSPSCRKDVRTHMRILSVVRIKAYSRYGYDYLSEIVLRRADFQEHTIAEKDFKNLYPSDFEDLNLLLLQGHLDHLLGSDKQMLSTAVKLWTRNLVIRQRVEDFQLGIESYQTQLNLTKPGWDAIGYEFKHDIPSLSLLEQSCSRVKEFKVERLNPGFFKERNDIVIPFKSKILRVLRIILVVLPEHPSDTKVLTMKMEILLEPTSNKLLVVGFNSLVHSLCALSTLRRSSLRTASAAVKPCQGDSSEFYLITGRIPDGSSCWQETCQFTTPCSHLTFLIKDIMITERPTTQLPQL
ncbi:hypothetical protein Tco_0851729 [Tanacetum coccineum]